MATTKTGNEDRPKGKRGALTVAENAHPSEFRKANDAIGLRVSEGRLSLLSRKLFNVMVFHAQDRREPGRDAPIDSEVNRKYFWLPLSEIARDTAYDSNDTELLKRHLEELQNIRVHMEDGRQWTSERLVSSVKLLSPLGLGKRGAPIWFGYAFPPEVAQMVMNPTTYTKLDIYYQTLFRSGSSLALYEICRRYESNPSKLTYIAEWEHWYEQLTGEATGSSAPPEYKYFKRDTLKPAILEMSTLTDLTAELIEHKRGRKVIGLQFMVERRPQAAINFPAPPPINSEIIDRLCKIGLGREEASNLSVQHPEEKITQALRAVESRMTAKSSAPLESPLAYFRWAIKQPLNPATTAPTKAPKLKAPAADLRERFMSARSTDAVSYFNELEAPAQQELLAEFSKTREGRAVNMRKGVKSPLIAAALGLWLGTKLWGEPTSAQLVTFAETGTVSG